MRQASGVPAMGADVTIARAEAAGEQKSLQQLEEELDSEMRFRPLLPRPAWLVAAALFALSLFHYYTAGFGLLPETLHRGIHLAFVLGLIFLVFPARRATSTRPVPSSALMPWGIGLQDWLLAFGAVAAALYVP
jgi:TRAP-type uncharacterized transport system fused permease subunit